MENITSVGLVVAIIGFAVKEFFSWLKERNLQDTEKRLKGTEEKLSSIISQMKDHDDKHIISFKQLNDLYEWHNREDQDGVKVWYIKQSLENGLKENNAVIGVLARNSELQTHLLKEIIQNEKFIIDTINTIERNTEDNT